MDLTYEAMGVDRHRRAQSLVCQIVSAVGSERAVSGAGWKSTGRHTGLPAVAHPPNWRCLGLSAEHTHLTRDSNAGGPLRLSDRVELVPHYSDSTILLHRTLHAHRNGVVQAAWRISGSGALQ